MPLARLDDRAVVAVTGPDARPFLHNLLTQDVESLGPNQLRHAALLTPQGRILHDMLIWGAEDGVRLDLAAPAVEDLVRRLTLYRLRAKVVINPTDDHVWARWGDQADADGPWRQDPRTPALGQRALTPTEPAEPDAAQADYHRHRITLGVPDAQADGLHDRAYPLEADYDLLGAIDFKKGCFIGQETTSRMHRRGTLKTRLLPLAFDGPPPPPGAEVLAGERRAGETLSGMEGRALALLRLDRLAGPLTVEGRPVRVDPPAWFPPLATVSDTPAD